MKTTKPPQSETERMARVIIKCYSRPTLELAAAELCAPLAPGTDIFRSLIVAGKATDFDHGVLVVASHLDGSIHEPAFEDLEMPHGKIEGGRLLAW